jgi:hypothetical protein
MGGAVVVVAVGERKGGCSGKRTLLVYKSRGAIVF